MKSRNTPTTTKRKTASAEAACRLPFERRGVFLPQNFLQTRLFAPSSKTSFFKNLCERDRVGKIFLQLRDNVGCLGGWDVDGDDGFWVELIADELAAFLGSQEPEWDKRDIEFFLR